MFVVGCFILAEKSPEIVCRPGSTQICWEACRAPPDPVVGLRGLLLKGGRGGEDRKGKGREELPPE